MEIYMHIYSESGRFRSPSRPSPTRPRAPSSRERASAGAGPDGAAADCPARSPQGDRCARSRDEACGRGCRARCGWMEPPCGSSALGVHAHSVASSAWPHSVAAGFAPPRGGLPPRLVRVRYTERVPHLRRDGARRRHICARIGLGAHRRQWGRRVGRAGGRAAARAPARP